MNVTYSVVYRSSGAGLGAYMEASVDNRFIMDMMFFIVVRGNSILNYKLNAY